MRNLFGLATILMALLLVACEADPAFVGTGTTGGTGATGAVFMGSGTGASFQSGVIAISQSNLQAGGERKPHGHLCRQQQQPGWR